MDLPPVSQALEADLRDAIRRHGVVLWLDPNGHYTGFVDRLIAGRAVGLVPYAVFGYRGSWLELMLALEDQATGGEKVPLLVHLPGLNEEGVRNTPLLELYLAGTRYRKALETLIEEAAAGRVRSETIRSFLGSGRSGGSLTLSAADAWLGAQLSDSGSDPFEALKALGLAALVHELLTAPGVADRQEPEWQALAERLAVASGMPATWLETFGRPSPGSGPVKDLLLPVCAWALCVEYVHDLRRPLRDERLAPALALPEAVVRACRELAEDLRGRHSEAYRRMAGETQAWLMDEEIRCAKPEDLGSTDTFVFEEDVILDGALNALGERRWAAAEAWAAARLDADAFWLRVEPARLPAWQLIQDAARLGLAIERAGPTLAADGDLSAAVARYRELGAAVDRTHRHLEQRRQAWLYPPLLRLETLRACLDLLRRLWRDWADAWARGFNALCCAQGFLPPCALQQRTLFDDEVLPLLGERPGEAGPTALFLVDALRYEMAEELLGLIEGTRATTVRLTARLAELPTVTEVGMNLLAPVTANGRVRPVIQDGVIRGFGLGEFTVFDAKTRRRAIHDRVGGATCPWMSLEDLVSRDAASLRQSVARARLVVVHSLEIDTAGEKGLGLAVFEQSIRRLRAAWRLLRDAGVQRFVITADHGFLLVDPSAGLPLRYGRPQDGERRHVLTPQAVDSPGTVRVALNALGYEGAEAYLLFPETTAVFETPGPSARFVHGGNSLQERVIPVLTLVHRAPAGGTAQRYAVHARPLDGVDGMHRIGVRVDPALQGALDFGGARDVELALRVPEAPEVQVELCQARGAVRQVGGSVFAAVGIDFEVFFRLRGPLDRRVQIQVGHPSAELQVTACVLDRRFDVTPLGLKPARAQTDSAAAAADARPGWLDGLADAGVRALFRHLGQHGTVTEDEAARMLGSPRAARRFARQWETLALQAPFRVRVESVGGVKRYVRL